MGRAESHHFINPQEQVPHEQKATFEFPLDIASEIQVALMRLWDVDTYDVEAFTEWTKHYSKHLRENIFEHPARGPQVVEWYHRDPERCVMALRDELKKMEH